MSQPLQMEYCVMHFQYPDDPHRGPWTEKECRSWVKEFEDDGGTVGAFYVARRVVTNWNHA